MPKKTSEAATDSDAGGAEVLYLRVSPLLKRQLEAGRDRHNKQHPFALPISLTDYTVMFIAEALAARTSSTKEGARG